MDETRASSPHPLSVSTAEPVRFFGESWECAADRMVKIELEAAEALAGLAHSAMPQTKNETPGGESLSHQVNSESPTAGDSVPSVPMSSDLAEKNQVVVVQKHCEKICNMMSKPVKAEQNTELKPHPISTTSYVSSSGNKSRQNLTEAEKEAQRLRRVLANRESARQTIRRRQAIYEELTRKAADLACENENLKREKELSTKEFDSLKSTNECLKAQMTKIVKAEVDKKQEESKLAHLEIAASSPTSCPLFIYNRPSFFPFLWPSIIQPSNSVDCGSQSGLANPSQVPMPATGKPYSFHEAANPTRINGPGTPLYVLPCPWLIPFPHPTNEPHCESFDLSDKLNESSLYNPFSTCSSSKTTVHVENNHLLLPIKVKTEDSNSVEAVPVNNLHENPFGFPPDGDGEHVGLERSGVVLMPTPLSCGRPAVTVKHENIPLLEHTGAVKAISPAASDSVNGFPEKNKESVVCPSRKHVDVIAAAEARRRRKEITKLKNLRCRQFRMCQVYKPKI